MSVLIKNATKQQVMKVLMNSTEWLPDDIEVIEIPTPHGRLIDSELAEHVVGMGTQVTLSKEERILAIQGLPTVIEAEGEE